ncbi:Choline transporter-like protein 1 [Aphelenchoides fujianensis]|nr:Choline transporter-like protein 1 [Aphelenchoides fujianensis]
MRSTAYEAIPPPANDAWSPRAAGVIGCKAARFDLRIERLLNGRAKKKGIRRFNPLVLTHRSCTDPFFGILFFLFLIGWAIVGWIAYSNGKPERVIFPTDSWGNACGKKRASVYDTSSKPYLHFFDITRCVSYTTLLSGCPSPQICVSKCPTAYFSYVCLATLPQAEFRKQIADHAFCHYSIDVPSIGNFSTFKDLVQSGLCAAYTEQWAFLLSPPPLLLGRCVPGVLVDASNTISGNHTLNDFIRKFGDGDGLVASDEHVSQSLNVVEKIASADSAAVVQKIVIDLSSSWRQILVLLGVAAVASFLWTFLMRIFGGLMIWLSIILLVIGLGVGCFFCYSKYVALQKAGGINDYSFTPVVSAYFEMPNTWYWLAVGLAVLEAVVFLIMLVIRKRIRIADEQGPWEHALHALLSPLFTSILHVGVFVLWGSIAVWLASVGVENCVYVGTSTADPKNGVPCRCDSIDPTDTSIPVNGGCRFAKPDQTRGPNLRSASVQPVRLLLGLLLLCPPSRTWSWPERLPAGTTRFHKPKDVPALPVLSSLRRSVRYHLGTLAFGSLILSITKMLRVILDFLYNKMKGWENPIGKAIYRALTCLFWCLERVLRFLTTNAYIMTAIYGRSFCAASSGRLLIVGGVGALSFYYFSGKWVIEEIPQVNLHFYFVPIVAVVVGSYFICDLFFEVYDMGVDTTFLCFLEDSEANDGTPEKPFYMSPTLRKLLNKENKF